MCSPRYRVDPRPRKRAGLVAAVSAGTATAAIAVTATTAAALDTNVDGDIITQTLASPNPPATPDPSQTRELRYGNFLVAPQLRSKVIYDDNIYRLRENKISDVRIEVLPSVTVRSNLPRHVLNFALSGKLVEFAENSGQGYGDVSANLSGGLHFDHAHTFSIGLHSELKHGEVGLSLTPTDAAEPVPLFHNRAALGLTRDAGRLYGTVSVTADRYDFSDVKDRSGNTIDQDSRDSDMFTAQLRTGYRFSPGFDVVAKLKAIRQLNDGTDLYSTQSTGMEAVAGVQFQTSPLLSWHLLGGYGVRKFDREGTDTLDTMLIEGGVDWSPTQRMTLKGTVRREIDAAETSDGQGVVTTAIAGSVQYEIYHNLKASAGLSAADYDFAGLDRRDTTYGASLGLNYSIAPNWDLSLGYSYEERHSTDPEFEMTNNKLMVGAKLSF